MACQHRKVNLCHLRGGKPAQVAKEGQQDTMHTTLLQNNNVTQVTVKHYTVTQMQQPAI